MEKYNIKGEVVKYPNSRNFCGGAFTDWLEVDLIKKCNGSCSWCVDREGWHPKKVASWRKIARSAIKDGAKNIILLGGEPTLYKDFKKLSRKIHKAKRNVWVTTNGSMLNASWVKENMKDVFGCNVSIHHYDLSRSNAIVGIHLEEDVLKEAIALMHTFGITIRFNCNTIHGEIDTADEMVKYVKWAKEMGADTVRFAELKIDEENFVDLAKAWEYRFGLNDDPFIFGCNLDAVIEGVPVNFRQMCGLQTTKRPHPGKLLHQYEKKVLYYDGFVYDGWQV